MELGSQTKVCHRSLEASVGSALQPPATVQPTPSRVRPASSPATAAASHRPGCVTAYALLQGIGGLLIIIAGLVLMSDLGGGGGALMFLFMLALGGLGFAVAWGLWNMKNWARLVVVAFTSLGVIGNVISMCATFSSGDGGATIIGVLVGIGIGGYIAYWFYDNKSLFS